MFKVDQSDMSKVNQYQNLESLRIFVTGNDGCDKTFLTKVMYKTLTKTLSYQSRSVEKSKVLLIPPTGVAAIDIEDLTVHSSLMFQ